MKSNDDLSLQIELARIRLREAKLTNDSFLIGDEENRLNVLVSRWVFSRFT